MHFPHTGVSGSIGRSFFFPRYVTTESIPPPALPKGRYAFVLALLLSQGAYQLFRTQRAETKKTLSDSLPIPTTSLAEGLYHAAVYTPPPRPILEELQKGKPKQTPSDTPLAYVTVTHYENGGMSRSGGVVVPAPMAERVMHLFHALYTARFPVNQLSLHPYTASHGSRLTWPSDSPTTLTLSLNPTLNKPYTKPPTSTKPGMVEGDVIAACAKEGFFWKGATAPDQFKTAEKPS